MNNTLFFGSLVALSLTGTISLAQTSSTASGAVTVNGKSVKLGFVQALEVQDWDYDFKTKKYTPVRAVRLFLSDASVEDVEDNFESFLRGREGKLHGVLLTFNAKGEPTEGQLIHQDFPTGAISFSGSGVARFERKSFDWKTIAGKVSTASKQEFQGATYEFNATFSAPIQKEPKPTVEGSATETTEPGKAVREFLKASDAQDIKALKGIFRAEIAAMLDDPAHKDEVMGLLAYSYAKGTKFTIARVFDFGERAWVELLSKRPSESGGAPTDVTTRVRLVRVNGAWKVQPM